MIAKLSEEWVSGFATFSRCKRYRYDLGRIGSANSKNRDICLFVLNNPSTADSNKDDATSRRGWAYTCDWGYRSMVFVNVNPFRATRPEDAEIPSEEILKQNDAKLRTWAKVAGVVVAAWGIEANDNLVQRALLILQRESDVNALALCHDGTPKHILYLKKDLKPTIKYHKFQK